MLQRFMFGSVLLSLLLVAGVVAEKTISFSGYTWQVKSDYGGPGSNNWDAGVDAVFVDDQGLHLTVGL